MHFQIGKWRFSIWVNVTFLIYSTCIVRSGSNMMERNGCVVLCCEETGAWQGIIWARLKKNVESAQPMAQLKKLKVYS